MRLVVETENSLNQSQPDNVCLNIVSYSILFCVTLASYFQLSTISIFCSRFIQNISCKIHKTKPQKYSTVSRSLHDNRFQIAFKRYTELFSREIQKDKWILVIPRYYFSNRKLLKDFLFVITLFNNNKEVFIIYIWHFGKHVKENELTLSNSFWLRIGNLVLVWNRKRLRLFS